MWCTMKKRSQVEEGNCGHWEFEAGRLESATLEQSSISRTLSTTGTRRTRLLRAASRDLASGMSLTRMASRVDETCITPERAGADVLVATETQGACLTVVGTDDKRIDPLASNGSVATTEDPLFVVHEVLVSGSTGSVLDEESQASASHSSQELVAGADAKETQRVNVDENRDKENLDPLGDWIVTPRRSPLPEWFPRKPLQDITNVLAGGLDDGEPQRKKKRNRKMVNTLVPPLVIEQDSPEQSAPKITHLKRDKQVSGTSKQAYNLRKNFR